jgi:hypothetical protein
MNHSPQGAQPPDPAAHVKDVDLSAKTFIPSGFKDAFVTFRVVGLKLLSKMFLKPLVRLDELWQFAGH